MSEKTLRMLKAALERVADGSTGIVVVPGMHDVRAVALALRDLDYGGLFDDRISKYRTSKGGQLFIMPMRNEAADPKKLRVRGYTEETTFWDPAVVREVHAKLIEEYHRYD